MLPGNAPIEILIAEEAGALRDFACRELKRRPGYHVEAVSDGLTAVEQAVVRQADVVVMDLRLPRLNGLSAARRIRRRSPATRIVFFSHDAPPDVVRATLAFGADGFVHKATARHLPRVVDAVVERRRQVGHGHTALARSARHHHQVQFCHDDATLIETAAHLLASALNENQAAIALSTTAHWQRLLERLQPCGRHLHEAIERGSFLHVDAEAVAAGILADGVARWRAPLVQVVQAAAAATGQLHPHVTVFGACAPILVAGGHLDAAMEAEQVGIDAVDLMPVDVLCAYPMLPVTEDRAFQAVCAHHGAIAIR